MFDTRVSNVMIQEYQMFDTGVSNRDKNAVATLGFPVLK